MIARRLGQYCGSSVEQLQKSKFPLWRMCGLSCTNHPFLLSHGTLNVIVVVAAVVVVVVVVVFVVLVVVVIAVVETARSVHCAGSELH